MLSAPVHNEGQAARTWDLDVVKREAVLGVRKAHVEVEGLRAAEQDIAEAPLAEDTACAFTGRHVCVELSQLRLRLENVERALLVTAELFQCECERQSAQSASTAQRTRLAVHPHMIPQTGALTPWQS